MSEILNKLVDDIIELILGDVCCHHEVSRDEESYYGSAEYSLDSEEKIKSKIITLLKSPPEKEGLVVDAIISKYPVAVRILLVQLIKQIEKEKKEGG